MQDIIFKNGVICNGSGQKSFVGDVSVKDGKISKISPSIEDSALETVDISGLVISPGFIDIHSHGDTTFLFDEKCEAKVYQGVTSELAGQCGSTIYPCPKDRMDNMSFYTGKTTGEYASSSFEEFMDKCSKSGKKMGTNLISLIGHGALRTGVMGQEARKATKKEIEEMACLLEGDMRSGAYGLSLGLGYSPGINADLDELTALGHVVKKYDGIITSHMRDQGDKIYDALEEMYEINRRTGAKVHIAHLKLSGKNNWGGAKKLIDSIREAQKSGISVTTDMYPYTASSSGITNSFPKWSIEGGTEKAAERLKGSEKDEIMEFLNENFKTQDDGERLLVVTTRGKFPVADGKNIWQISQELKMSMADTIAEITVKTDSHATCIAFGMREEDVLYLLSQNDIVIGSDGSGFSFDPGKNTGKPHPRNFGTFPRFLRIVRENNICSIEAAVNRMTKQSAEILGLKKRGELKEGYIADITVFNPKTVSDNNSFENPFIKNTGIEHVVIGGKFALFNGVQTDNMLGKFILK